MKKTQKIASVFIGLALFATSLQGCSVNTPTDKNISNKEKTDNPIGVVSMIVANYQKPLNLSGSTVVTSRKTDSPESIIVPGNANVKVSSNSDKSGFSTEFVYDGDTTANSGIGWSSKANSDSKATESITVDYKRLNFINRVDLYPRTDNNNVGTGFPKTIKVEISSDNVLWQTVSYVTGYPKPSNDIAIIIRFSSQLAQYIRITGSDLQKISDGYVMQLAEIMAYYENYKPGAIVKAKEGATYYVSDSIGSDDNNGLSEDKPFKTLAKASSLLYFAGNKILYKCGDSFINQIFYPDGSGTAQDPIIIGSYGAGKKPIFKAGNSGGSGIKLIDQSYISISGIEFSNSIFGILAVADETSDNKGLYISDCNFNNMTCPTNPDSNNFIMPYPEAYFAAGINICAFGNNTLKDKTYYSDIKIENCTFDRTDTGILNTLNDYPVDLGGYPTTGHKHFSTSSFKNVDISDVVITKSYRSGGIMLYGCKDSSIDNAFISQTGYMKGMFWGTCSAQISMCENFVTKNSEFCFTEIQTGNSDGEGFDFESGNINCTLYNTYIHDNAGPAILIYGGNAGWRGANTGIVVDSCIFENNDKKNKNLGVLNYYTGNGGVIRNTTIKLLFENQTMTWNNREFDELFTFSDTNRVITAGGLIKSGQNEVTVNSNDKTIVYTDGFTLTNDKYVSTKNAQAIFKFLGTSISINGSLLSGAKGKVYIDGVEVGLLTEEGTIFTKSNLSKTTHVVRIVAENEGVELNSITYKILDET